MTKIPHADLQDFERIFVFFNPASTHAKRSERRIKELEKLYPHKVEVVKTSSEGRAANQAILRKLAHRLSEKTLVGIAAGDGTVGLVVETLTATGKDRIPQAASKAPILPLWGGNANDLAYMLNGLSVGKRLSRVFSKAEIVPIYPLIVTITSPDKKDTSTHIAACYAALGVSGRMAHTLNKRSYRAPSVWKSLGFKVIRELVYVTQTFKIATKFTYSQSNHKHRAYELLFANGSRMAKVDRLPITLSEPYFYADHLEHSTFGAVMRKFMNVARGQRRERRLHQRLHFTVHDQVWAQFDGEPEKIVANSEMSVRLHDQPFYALASSMRPPRSARRPGRLRMLTKHNHTLHS